MTMTTAKIKRNPPTLQPIITGSQSMVASSEIGLNKEKK